MDSTVFYFFITLLLVSCGTHDTEQSPFFANMASSQDMDDDPIIFPDSTEYRWLYYYQYPPTTPTTSTTPKTDRTLFRTRTIQCDKCKKVDHKGNCRRIQGCRLDVD
ncbi:hypothetical protein J6590_089958 [Homalodisca vitripennis]|nr:hypothetical protein J6590_089958 [Homalodisca vitripennis]